MAQKITLCLLFFIIIINSCKNQNDTTTQIATTTQTMDPIQKNIQDIEAYLRKKDITAQKTTNNVYYVITREGDGTHPTIADNVTLHYKGYFLDGNKFDSSYDGGKPITYPLSGFVKGWQEGIPMVSKGGAATLFIPSNLGYGSNARPGIPANSVLLFDVELLKINNE
ncbi:MAG: FKBP-type peptidyl-prolyl cis-trans isomerase [Saprospiraceae bacterium]